MEPISTFSNTLSFWTAHNVAAATLAFSLAIGCWLALRRGQARWAALSFALAAAGGLWLCGQAKSLGTKSPVAIYPDAVHTPYGHAAFADIRYINILEELSQARREPLYLLVIEEKNGRIHALSAREYPIQAIKQHLDVAIATSQRQGTY